MLHDRTPVVNALSWHHNNQELWLVERYFHVSYKDPDTSQITKFFNNVQPIEADRFLREKEQGKQIITKDE